MGAANVEGQGQAGIGEGKQEVTSRIPEFIVKPLEQHPVAECGRPVSFSRQGAEQYAAASPLAWGAQ